MIKLQRPDYFGEWTDEHINWAVEIFKNKTNELSAGDIQKKIYLRKGEPYIHVQDFRNLMRLMVKNKRARVTNGFCQSKGYKIRMVSDEYPYVQEVFNISVFDTIEWVFTNQCKDWEPSEREKFVKKMRLYMIGFGVYTHMGGDFNYIFEVVSEEPEKLTVYPDDRTSFILYVLYFVSIYRMLKTWIYSLKIPDQFYKRMLVDYEITCFAPFLCSHILAQHLVELENKDREYSRAHGYYLLSLLNDCRTDHKTIEKIFNSSAKKFTFTDEMRIHFFTADVSSWLLFFDEFDNQDVKKAVREVKKAEANRQDYLKRVFKRARR
jgi:hypothetical protein